MKKVLTIFLSKIFIQNLILAKDVIYNKETNIFHDENCLHAKQCTKNCVKINIDKAFEKKAKPCEKCRTSDENWEDERDYTKRKQKEQQKKYLQSPGIKQGGNYSFEVRK